MAGSDIKSELAALRQRVYDVEAESRANFGAVATSIRRTRQQVAVVELAQSVRKLRPPTALVDWTPRGGEPAKPSLQDSLIDRLRKGDAVADSIGNSQPVIGQTNLLRNPTLDSMDNSFAAGVEVQVGSEWRATMIQNSGTAPALGTVDDLYPRGDVNSNPFNSAVVEVFVSNSTNTYDVDLFVYPTTPFVAIGTGTLPYLVGAVRSSKYGTSVAGDFVTARVRMELYNTVTSAVAAFGEWLDLRDMAGSYQSRQSVVALAYTSQTIRWRYRLHLVKTGVGNAGANVYFGEPQLHFAYSPDPIAFAPQIGAWVPNRLASQFRSETSPRFLINGGEISWGPGTSSADVSLSRTTANFLSLYDPSVNGPAGIEIKGGAAFPTAAPTSYGRLWFNTTTKSFWQTDDAGVDQDLGSTGVAASLFDTDVQFSRMGARAWVVDPVASVGGTYMNVRGNSVSDAGFVALRIDDAVAPIALITGGGTTPALNFGSGAAARDVNLYRSGVDILKTDDTFNAVLGYQFNGTAVVGSRKTGWTAATGTATRTSFATDTVTLINLARAVKALTDDLITHGLIGT